ncbi:hypothetical protein DPMN_104103 [Dreissena polymorpha]|uniref:Uncharacterized protein n=1 Tax=Dreissena polymorpha TaxID=45954 RepID=A0A9D4H9R0_DREPO|nr:hypothetical protein DPMN_104103 [Dreissena polymorpha]
MITDTFNLLIKHQCLEDHTTDGRTDRRTDGQTDGRTDRRGVYHNTSRHRRAYKNWQIREQFPDVLTECGKHMSKSVSSPTNCVLQRRDRYTVSLTMSTSASTEDRTT